MGAGRMLCLVLAVMGLMNCCGVEAKKPRRILLDTDVDTDDFFALFYLLKQNRSEFDLKVWFMVAFETLLCVLWAIGLLVSCWFHVYG